MVTISSLHFAFAFCILKMAEEQDALVTIVGFGSLLSGMHACIDVRLTLAVPMCICAHLARLLLLAIVNGQKSRRARRSVSMCATSGSR